MHWLKSCGVLNIQASFWNCLLSADYSSFHFISAVNSCTSYHIITSIHHSVFHLVCSVTRQFDCYKRMTEKDVKPALEWNYSCLALGIGNNFRCMNCTLVMSSVMWFRCPMHHSKMHCLAKFCMLFLWLKTFPSSDCTGDGRSSQCWTEH